MARVIPRPPDRPALPTVPTVEAWRAMTPEARLRFQIEVNSLLGDPVAVMSEGRPHKKAKARAIDALSLHFKAIGRIIYLAEEMSVLYPGEVPFSPDILAVLDVEEPEDDERMSWVVADEGQGLDLVIEVLYRGDRDKDLVENVERYARLGITEYFVYDRHRQRIHGYRLPAPDDARYQSIVPQLGHYRSLVLGLDLAIIGNTLRFLVGEATLPLSVELIGRLHAMAENLEAKANQAEAEAEQARAQAEQAAQALVAGLREALVLLLDVRGLPCSDAARARIQACDDPAILRGWLARVKTAESADAMLADKP